VVNERAKFRLLQLERINIMKTKIIAAAMLMVSFAAPAMA
jgi:hypothetical protein